jgi:hypothetical protein
MTTPTTPAAQAPNLDVEKLKNMVRQITSQLMAAHQKVQQLTKENLDLTAALHLNQTDKNGIDVHIHNQLKAVPVQVPISETETPKTDADTVQA